MMLADSGRDCCLGDELPPMISNPCAALQPQAGTSAAPGFL
jgi:hypothetical protein